MGEYKERSAFIGLPWKREVDSHAAFFTTSWALQHVKYGINVAIQGVFGNLVWVGRSALIHVAKLNLEKQHNLIHVQLDSDAYARTNPMEAYEAAEERFAQGAGIVVAPVHSIAAGEEGSFGWVKEWNEHPSGDKDEQGFRISSGSFSWVFFSPEFLEALKPEGEWTPANLKQRPVPLYTWTDPQHTEDVRLIKRAEELGFSTWADKRLKCGHGKLWEVPPYGALEDET